MRDYISEVIKGIRETEKAMRVSVQIPIDEVERLVITRLIETRNSEVNRMLDMSHFDKVLRHFLTGDEFKKYVIDRKPLKP